MQINYARDNYRLHPDNAFTIIQYYKCLIRQKDCDEEAVKNLLEEVAEINSLISHSKQFYPEMNSLYYSFILRDFKQAIQILEESEAFFENKVFYFRNIFDLYEMSSDVLGMENSLKKIEALMDKDEIFLPLYTRRKYVLQYMKEGDIKKIERAIKTAKITEQSKKSILNHINQIANRT